MTNIHSERVGAIRRLMEENGWDAVVISGSDPHGSEYPAPRWKQVEWVSGFTGEAGDMVITRDHAGLWTDSRYFIQAAEQLAGSGIELHKTRIPGAVGLPGGGTCRCSGGGRQEPEHRICERNQGGSFQGAFRYGQETGLQYCRCAGHA